MAFKAETGLRKAKIHGSNIGGKLKVLASDVRDAVNRLMGIKSPAEERLENCLARHEKFYGRRWNDALEKAVASLEGVKENCLVVQEKLKQAKADYRQVRSEYQQSAHEEKLAKVEYEEGSRGG